MRRITDEEVERHVRHDIFSTRVRAAENLCNSHAITMPAAVAVVETLDEEETLHLANLQSIQGAYRQEHAEILDRSRRRNKGPPL